MTRVFLFSVISVLILNLVTTQLRAELITAINIDDEDPLSARKIVRKIQVYKDIEVWGHGAVYEKLGDRETLVDGSEKEARINPSLIVSGGNFKITSPEQAFKMAKTKGIQKCSLVGKNIENLFCEDRILVNDAVADRLVYYCSILVRNANSNNFTNAFVTMAAKTGEVVGCHHDVITACRGKQGGNTEVGQYKYGEGRWFGRELNLKGNYANCNPSNDKVEVACANNEFMWPPRRCFTNPSDTCKSDTGSSFAQVNDAWFFANRFTDILTDKFHDNTLAKLCPNKIWLCVLYGLPETAFFTDICEMYFGIGGNNMVDMAAPSIIGHEFGHALISVTSKLEYRCQSGAIAESFADFCGILLKSSLDDFETDWWFGDDVTIKKGFVEKIRRMDLPTDDGFSIDHAEDVNLNQCPDVRHASGIYNKAIVNLVSMKSWDLLKAFRVFLRANKFYWKAQTGFDEGLCGLILAAKDLKFNEEDVQEAFAKVGVFCDCPPGWEKKIEAKNGQKRTYCFKLFNKKMSWIRANAYCNAMGGQLVSLTTDEKQSIVSGMLKNRTDSCWLGGDDVSIEGSWRWLSGAILKYRKKHWLKVSSDDTDNPYGNDETINCIAMEQSRRREGFGWNGKPCTEERDFVCELIR